MWGILVAAVMFMLTSHYALFDQKWLQTLDDMKARTVAEEMALYREAVIVYFTENDFRNMGVDMTALKPKLPTWSSWYTGTPMVTWLNYRDANGVIYVYALSLPKVNITSEIVQLSQNSMLAGVFHTGDVTLHSPVFGDTGIPLTSLAMAGVVVPNGSPLWLATAR